MSQPSIFQLPLWENHKHNIFIVIRDALLILASRPNLPSIEDHPKKPSLNRELYICFRKAAHRKNLSFLLPTREGKSPAFEGDLEPTERENKIPDFHWKLVDPLANEENCERRFILECKRLGKPSSPNWNLNENYVQNGIRRFIAQPHEYGKGDDSCGMIGYIQNMDFDEILQEIHYAIGRNPEPISPLPTPINGWREQGISELEHDLERPFPISPFRMYHFWVDLRSSC